MDPQSNERRFRLETIARNGAFAQVTTLKRNKAGLWGMDSIRITKEKSGEPHEVLKDKPGMMIDPPDEGPPQ